MKNATRSDIKTKLQKQWSSSKFHSGWLNAETAFPYQLKLPRPTDKQLLHEYSAVQDWLTEMQSLEKHRGIRLVKQQISYSKMGKQLMPMAVEFDDIESLARYLGKWQEWSDFTTSAALINEQLPALSSWLNQNIAQIVKYQNVWPKLIRVCQYFMRYPKPACYIRQLDIPEIDTKFIEQHKGILKKLFDDVLPADAINHRYEKLSEHGFEKRFGLLFDQPQIRFRLLDPLLAHEFAGLTDITIPVEQFNNLDLLLDRVFITENKINGLAFPKINNAIIIFGLGYGIQTLKHARWLTDCRVHYWGDIDTHGFAMLSQLRSYVPNAQSMLMDEATLLSCKSSWGQEEEHKRHKAEHLPNLNNTEQALYQALRCDQWQEKLRLEQELVPISMLEEWVKRF